MEYSEFVEELEISLQDQMKGETAFSFRAQTMQKNGEEHKEILYCRAGDTWGLPLPTEEAYDDFLEGIFTPFRKGIKGEFGLGLSIVKKTLNIMNYDITIKNEKKGVSFIIKRNS